MSDGALLSPNTVAKPHACPTVQVCNFTFHRFQEYGFEEKVIHGPLVLHFIKLVPKGWGRSRLSTPQRVSFMSIFIPRMYLLLWVR